MNKEKPSFELSGALLEDTNTFRGVVIKYSEPPEARIPKKRWRLYPFKNDEFLPVMYIHRQSAYLLGRHRRIADIPIDHPSCSKQHAVFQYRSVLLCIPLVDGDDLATCVGGGKANNKLDVHRLESACLLRGFRWMEFRYDCNILA